MDDYSTARTIGQALISNRVTNLTIEEIRRCVEKACRHFPDLAAEGQEKLVRELETMHQTIIGETRELVGEDEGWGYWLPERRGHLEWEYWERYRELLRRGSMSAPVQRRLGESTDKVLGLLGDPRHPASWDRRGLVVGLVQSGKTSHYVGLINKAVDAGYRVIVVLTGFTESLRIQTQIRVEEGFLGYHLEPGEKRGEMRPPIVGVGEISPEPKPNCVTTRSHDFKKVVAVNLGVGIHAGAKEIVFVIKKNVGVLRNLLNWIHSFGNATDVKGRRFVKDVPLLVIDDESDVGSIDTKKGNIVEDDADPDHEPSRINELIRQLLSLFDQSSYVGYTATPFANVLVHEGGRTDELGEDLFPRSFIVSLPTPSDHVGPSMIFGRELDEGNLTQGLPIIRTVPKKESEGQDAWIPPVHKKWHRPLYEGRSELPPSLRKAVLSFVLVCSARRLRRTGPKHDSMLVHVTRFNDVQDEVEDQVKKELDGIVDRLRSRTANDALERELRELWEDDFQKSTREIGGREGAIFQNPVHKWETIEAELLAASSSIQVRTINGRAGDVLDYEKHKEDGLHVIAIGGDKLARGLTLDGLSVSYFLRCSRMYDTLMQMGRWFGYRPGYLDLCRLYTTADLKEWFGHIAHATEELRNEFDLMETSGGTPRDFGLRVRSHPDLMVTSQVKMRHGRRILITFQGKAVETDNFKRDAQVVEANWHAIERLVLALEGGDGKRQDPTSRRNSTMWDDVSPATVISFLDDYEEHESAHMARTRLLMEYIEKETSKDRLKHWTVLIPNGSKEPETIGETQVNLVDRKWKHDEAAEKGRLIEQNRFRIGILKNPLDESVDLTDDQIEAARRATEAAWKAKGRKDRPKVPAGRFLRQQRDPGNGLLILYLIEADKEKSENEDRPLVGFVLSFPAVDGASASQVTYTVNNVYQQQEMG